MLHGELINLSYCTPKNNITSISIHTNFKTLKRFDTPIEIASSLTKEIGSAEISIKVKIFN